MAVSPIRFITTVVALALALGAIGWGWEFARFGSSTEATARRLETEVRRQFSRQAFIVEQLAGAIAEDQTIRAAIEPRDRVATLFRRLTELTPESVRQGISSTIYAPAGPAGAYRILAWSDGPADDLSQTPDRLTGPAALFVAPGTAGLSLVFVQPVESDGRRIGVVAVETVFSPGAAGGHPARGSQIRTSYGSVQVVQHFAGAGDSASLPNRFVVSANNGVPLVEVHYSPADLAAQRTSFRRRALGLAAMPLVVALLLGTGPILARRARVQSARAWLAWSAAATALVLAAALALIGLAYFAGLAPVWRRLVIALTALAMVAMFGVSGWWRRWGRHAPESAPVRFILEQLGGGLLLAGALYLVIWLLSDPVTPASLARFQLPLLPVDRDVMLDLGTLLIVQIAILWAAAATVAILAARWKLNWRHPIGWAAVALWMAPAVALFGGPALAPAAVRTAAISSVALTALFGLFATSVRRAYRHTSQAMRLILVFAALLLPVVFAYPLAAASTDRAIRTLVERDYAPATAAAQQAAHLKTIWKRAQDEIDRIPNLLDLLSSRTVGVPVQTQSAYYVWNQTTLSRERVSSGIELYGPDRELVSRFALNVPEFQTERATWLGTNCQSWEVFAEVSAFGAEERRMLHSERAICDAAGHFAGAVVIHILPDYRSLPFVSSANPYYEVLGGSVMLPPRPRIADLQVVVYGWSLRPEFTSGRAAWPITEEIYNRLYRSREPFWAQLTASGARHEVFFLNDRAGIYALGFPSPTVFQHLSRLSEVAVLVAFLFVLMLVGAAVYAPFSRRTEAPLRMLFHEIRTSFYRKLFLFFVFAAVGPVLLFAVAFNTYMAGKFRDDVESEAASVVGVAQRVFEQLSAATDQQSGQAQLTLSDDLMIWIRQVIGQDVNLYEGPALVATSQRDLFDSGLLPTRTPAAVYRAIALYRLPVSVATDRIGTFEYLVAATRVSARRRDASFQPWESVLTVPLASRQRELERQIEELNRGVLVGAVVVVLFAAGLGASVAGRVSDPVARLSRATRLIAAGRLDERLVADTADELGRLVEDFNSMTETLVSQRAELARTNQLKAWAEMARQVAHEIKNPLTPIQLAAEHLQKVHEDQRRPLGPVFDQCLTTILRQVKLLRQIASEFSSFAGQLKPRLTDLQIGPLIDEVIGPYRLGLAKRVEIDVQIPPALPSVRIDRTLVSRALTNLVENAVQAMPSGGRLMVSAASRDSQVEISVADTGVGMDEEAVRRAFEPYFSTKTAGSGLGLANAKRNIELCGGTIAIASAPDRGTTVRVTLPAAQPPVAGAASP